MWYHRTLTVPAGTAENSPVRAELKLTHGVIIYIGVGFPTGCKQLVKVRIYHEEHQIFPSNPDEAACWNGAVEGGVYHQRLTGEPYHLVIRAYAPLATAAHSITIFVNEVPVEVAEPWAAPQSALDKIKGLFGF